jgi:hypothetical protein
MRLFARLLEGLNFSVVHASVCVNAFADNVSVTVNNHGPDVRIRRGYAHTFARESKRTPHEMLTIKIVRHIGLESKRSRHLDMAQ